MEVFVHPAVIRREFEDAVIRVGNAHGIIHFIAVAPDAVSGRLVLQHLHRALEHQAPEKPGVVEID